MAIREGPALLSLSVADEAGPVQRRRLPASRLLQEAAVRGPDGPAWAISPAEYAEWILAAAVRWIDAGYFARLDLAKEES